MARHSTIKVDNVSINFLMERYCIDNEVVWRLIIDIHGAPLLIAFPKFPGVGNRNIAMGNIVKVSRIN